MNFYNISYSPERQQVAQHYHSSLEQPNLENISSQLYVAKQRNQHLAQLYFQNKYGSPLAYDQFLDSHQLSQLKQPTQTIDFREHLERKAHEIHKQEQIKIQKQKQKAKNQFSNQEDNANLKNNSRQEGQKGFKRGELHQNNSQMQINKNQHEREQEIQRQQQEGQQYTVFNVQHAKENAYMSDFKKYLSNKHKNTSFSNSKIPENYNDSILQHKNTKETSSPHQNAPTSTKNYEEELVKKIFKSITGQKQNKKQSIEKLELVEYLISNKKILKVLGISNQEISEMVMKQTVTRDKNRIDFCECLLLIYKCLGKDDEVKKFNARRQFDEVPSGCMVPAEMMKIFEENFKRMDKHLDLIVKRMPFIQSLVNDSTVKRHLNKPAVFEPQYQKHISLRRVFQRIEIQTLLGSEEDRKLHEFLSWNQFLQYLESGHKERSKYDLIILLDSLKNEQKFGLGHLPEQVSDLISEAFRKLDKGEEYFAAIDVINQIKLNKEYEIEKYTFVRNENQDTNLPSETLEEVLARIKTQGQKYLNVKEFLEYFSEKGKPVEEIQAFKEKVNHNNYSGAKVTFIEKAIFQNQHQKPDGYDSDPEFYNHSVIEDKQKLKKNQKQNKNYYETVNSILMKSNNQMHEINYDKAELKVTVPIPFKFEGREKERSEMKSKLNKSMSQKSQHFSLFRAKSIPKKVSQIGLLTKMNLESQKKIQDRKKNSMLMTLANEKPFSFEDRKINKKTQEERKQFNFQAKPIPWYCSVDLLNKKKEEEILRNQRIAKMAQQNLAKSKLPPRMEKDFLQKQAKRNLEINQNKREHHSIQKVKNPPNFQKLHKQFEDALERKKKENKKTEIKEFKFAQTKPSQVKQNHEKAEEFVRDSYKHISIPANETSIDIFANSTAKFNQQVQKRRIELEEKRKQEQLKKEVEEERLKIDEKLKQKIQDVVYKDKDNKEKEQIAARKAELAEQEKKFKEWKNERIENGRKQPLLVERLSKRDEKLQKMKKLFEISQTLKKNGLSGKEHDKFFNKEERLLLEDYTELRRKL